jgi:hypothetical protein
MSFFDPEMAKQVTENGQKIIESVLKNMDITLHEALNKVVSTNTPDVQTAKMLNEERDRRMTIKRMAMDYFERSLNGIKHDTSVNHGANMITVDDKSVEELSEFRWYEPAVCKCMKCSMMYFALVILNREVAEDILIPPFETEVYPTPHGLHEDLLSVARETILGKTDVTPKDINELASRYLEEDK